MVYADLLRASMEVGLGEFAQATKWSTGAVEAAGRSQSPFLLSQSMCVQGQIEEAQDSIPAARRSYRSALQSLEKAPTGVNAQGLKLTLSRNPFELYEALVALSLFASTDPGDFEPAFEIAEKAKSRELA